MKRLLFTIGLFAFSITFFNSCSSVTSENLSKADIYYDEGTRRLVDKDYTNALDMLLKAKELNPKDSKIRNNLGMSYYFKKQYPLAIDEISEAIKLDERNSDARNNLGAIYIEQGELEKAEKELNKVIEDLIYQHQFRTYYNLALISQKKKDNIKVIHFLKKSIEEKGDYCPSHFLLGKIYQESFQFQMSYDHFLSASQGTCYQYPEPHYYQALMLFELKKIDKARDKFLDFLERHENTDLANSARLKLKEVETIIRSRGSFYTDQTNSENITSKL